MAHILGQDQVISGAIYYFKVTEKDQGTQAAGELSLVNYNVGENMTLISLFITATYPLTDTKPSVYFLCRRGIIHAA